MRKNDRQVWSILFLCGFSCVLTKLCLARRWHSFIAIPKKSASLLPITEMPADIEGHHDLEELNMKRRDFIAKGGIVGAGVVGVAALSGCEEKKEVAAPAVVKDRIEIAMVSTWPRDFPGLGTGAQRTAQRLSDVSDGRIQVTYMRLASALVRLTRLMKLLQATRRLIMRRTIIGKGSTRVGPTILLFLLA